MSNHLRIVSFLLALLLVNIIVLVSSTGQQVYIVYLGDHSKEKTSQQVEDIHRSYLHSVKGSKEEAESKIIYSYKNVINGFSALLTPEEAVAISKMDGVVSVFKSQFRKLHTTRSWDFISLLEANWNPTQANGEALLSRANYGKNVIVGLLDTGVWPEFQSFNDVGMEPIPTSWNGICQSGEAFNSSNCNRKLIGARYYLNGYERYYGRLQQGLDYRSPRDINGHGTHTSSTVGGRRVPNAAGLGGFGNGTATGGAPLVRLAMYKVCWQKPPTAGGGDACFDADIMAAFDDAIADGVHVISQSIGSNTGKPYTQDAIAIGALQAVKRNIVVSCSAGNEGPTPSSVTNIPPWIITVGASSIDRMFSSPVGLGNGVTVQGQSITPFQRGTYSLVYGGYCNSSTLPPSLVRGKAVLCWRGAIYESLQVQREGGAAAILGNVYNGIGVQESPYLIPATVVLNNETNRIYNYIRSNGAPTATLNPSTTLLGTKPAPFMAPFTSVGPSSIEPNILKPDITAPGFNILAAWSGASSPLQVPADRRRVKYNFLSGTSMSCPHVSAVAALLKAIHPSWSSAAIRSAITTTAKQTNNLGNPITNSIGNPATPFEYGAGHVQPSKAADPGLVYDASYTDYLLFLCRSSGNTLDPSFTCPANPPPPSNLNYPSLALANLRGTATVNRTVTNVGTGSSSYTVTVNSPPGYSVQVSPTRLSFSAIGQKQNFSITVQPQSSARRNVFAFGWYTWSDGIHQVRSPIAVSSA